MVENLLEKYKKVKTKKNSILCIGLDPVVEKTGGKDILDFCLDIIEKTSNYVAAYKPNSQFILFPLNLKQLKELNEKIHQAGCISILDHKLSDIGSSNESALHWIKKGGFDALTFSPFAGNIEEATEQAHKNNLGLFVLTLMSNPEAIWIEKETMCNGMPLYQKIAEKVKSVGVDGLVIGATGHVTEYDIRKVRELSGEDVIFLCPGIGAQGGDLEKILRNGGDNVLINVSRAIIYDKEPEKKAKEFRDLINSYR